MEAIIFEQVAKAGAAGIYSDILLDRLYADHADGGPLEAKRSMYVMIHRINSKLIDHRKIIRGVKNGGGKGSPCIYELKSL